jgi:hypothetical protein
VVARLVASHMCYDVVKAFVSGCLAALLMIVLGYCGLMCWLTEG